VNSTVLFVPGLRDHVADHWQTLAAQELPGSRTVPPLERDKLSCAARVEALDRALAKIDGPVILAAHSAGCLMVAHWVKAHWVKADWATAHDRPIKGALLATPVDAERPLPDGYPTLDALQANGWLPVPRDPLPFPTLVAVSANDPLAKFERAQALGRDWRGRIVHIGRAGHLNPAAGFGRWPRAISLLEDLDAPQSAPGEAAVG
jgi:predicted alpha/beta hydrolase family esterase